MRIFNGTNSVLSLPLSGNQKLEVYPKSVSQEFMGSNEFLSMLITSFSCSEIALIVSGPYELNVCANIPTAVNYTVQTLDEAIIRFDKKKKSEPKVDEQPKEECKCGCETCNNVEEPIKEDVGPEITEPEPIPEEPKEEEVVEEVTEEPVEEPKPKKKRRKKASEE